MAKLPNLKYPPKPPRTTPVKNLRVAELPKPTEEPKKALPEELWALERADLMRRAAEGEKRAAILERAITLQVIDPKGKIRTLETIAAESEKLLEEAKTTHEQTIERIRSRLGITGAFDIDSTSGVVSTGSTPEHKE